jgi:hypothetical protein
VILLVGISSCFKSEPKASCPANTGTSESLQNNPKGIIPSRSTGLSFVDRNGSSHSVSCSTDSPECSPEFYQRKYSIKYWVKPLVTAAMAKAIGLNSSHQLAGMVDEVMKTVDLNSEQLLRGNEQLVRRYVCKYVCKAVCKRSKAHLI